MTSRRRVGSRRRQAVLPRRLKAARNLATFLRVRQKDRLQEPAKRLRRVANEHVESRLIDYKQRRKALSGWAGIDPESWSLVQPNAQPGAVRGDLSGDRASASIWLWCELTAGDERAAPIPRPGDHDHGLDALHDLQGAPPRGSARAPPHPRRPRARTALRPISPDDFEVLKGHVLELHRAPADGLARGLPKTTRIPALSKPRSLNQAFW